MGLGHPASLVLESSGSVLLKMGINMGGGISLSFLSLVLVAYSETGLGFEDRTEASRAKRERPCSIMDYNTFWVLGYCIKHVRENKQLSEKKPLYVYNIFTQKNLYTQRQDQSHDVTTLATMTSLPPIL